MQVRKERQVLMFSATWPEAPRAARATRATSKSIQSVLQRMAVWPLWAVALLEFMRCSWSCGIRVY